MNKHTNRSYEKNSYRIDKKRKWFFMFLFFLIGSYGIFYIYKHFYKKDWWNKRSLEKQVANIVTLLERIDRDCGIVSFVNDVNTIDFLNIKEFSGSTVGSMQVAQPHKWHGPYSDGIPLYKQKPFALFVHWSGCYVVPGEGTILDNDKIVGRDIKFDEHFDYEKIFTTHPELLHEGKRLVGRVECRVKGHHKITHHELKD